MEKDYSYKKSKIMRKLIIAVGILLLGSALMKKKKTYIVNKFTDTNEW